MRARRRRHRQVGRLDVDCVVLASPLSRQRLLLLQPVPGTPTTDRLNRLRWLTEEVS
ncbi:MmyB family transcriptional regulator [Streptomyces avermitilis]|uniref:MmyB family transcriptional regulator n=1 Tax=Streptomyces avermitilis TaxID=33903 RepID=UPI0033AFE900